MGTRYAATQLPTLARNTMAYLPCEGIFAIHKPPSITSAQVIRDCQSHFKSSTFFKPWLDREQARKDSESHNQRQKRRSWKQRQPLQVKIGHGGTLDPMATGVLVLGVGNGTKRLPDFIGCTKSYETVVLFGAATDSYDAVGKIIGRKGYEHVTREKVEKALENFRGQIMQRPPIFSALRVQGKRLYEYAREGKEVPVEIQERPVEVKSLEMVEWMEGGSHEYRWPEEEAEPEAKGVAEKVLHLESDGQGAKRKREEEVGNGDTESSKRTKASPESTTPPTNESKPTSSLEQALAPPTLPQAPQEPCPAPACRLRMSVTSGFYVRSLCHDLGAAVDSMGLMSTLVRSRQGEFSLGENVLEYVDLEKGEEVWGPKIQETLQEWQKREAARPADETEPADLGGRSERKQRPMKGHPRVESASPNKEKVFVPSSSLHDERGVNRSPSPSPSPTPEAKS
ncbi:pseudouridine synthase pus4 [Saxophila tyrrhenica]|uniref:tRNA pseudouridine(55) synthase n=1 Tax=Saxophila tyrrhenica TaxID=1690608 RepID=A0AAV9P3U6_9PEZI|nr:pseudouridine synthase pus4 [Saxophila tyrrhenica]